MYFNRKILRVICFSLYLILGNEYKVQAFLGLNSIDSTGFQKLQSKFINVPDSIHTSVYWYWISDHLSKEGVIKDLQAMKAVGINRAFIGNIGLDDVPYGKVKIFSDMWWEILHTALKTATELNIEIGIFNSPGWSQSGGPWIKPEQSMRYLTSVDTNLTGNQHFKGKVPAVQNDFQHVKTLAFKLPNSYGKLLDKSQLLSLSSSPDIKSLNNILDQDIQSGVLLPNEEKTVEIIFKSQTEFLARSLTLYPFPSDGRFSGRIEILTDDGYVFVREFKVDRRNASFNVGFEKYAPVSISFKEIKSKVFKLVLYNIEGAPGISEIEFSSEPKNEYFKEKTLAKMHPTPLPYWDDYLWPMQDELSDRKGYLLLNNIIDITSYVNHEGELHWKVPQGNWRILHTGMLPTGVTNGPASKEGTGLEVDKMNHLHVIKHFDAFLGEIQRRIPAEDRKTWKVAVQDSYETGSQNWTDDFEKKFTESFGYSPTPYIPVIFGYVVSSQDHSDRFLWDLRRFVADKIAYEYVGGLRTVSHKHGLTIWLENYGHWGFPGEFLQYGGQSDEIGGEFWNEGGLGDIENKAASSAAHIYGKTKVSAESFTASGNTFGRYPALLKARADRFFTEGINNSLLHVYIHQPYEDRKPGVNTWFGTEFNRHNTWFYDMDIFIDYLKRCNFLLQQGKYVADVAYFIGEDVPKMTGVQNPSLPKGYSFDYMNAEVILNRMDLKNGMFTLPDGMQYKVLVLPSLETIRPEVLVKIGQMVEKGGIVLGPKPKRSPSLRDISKADNIVRKWAKKLWGNFDTDKPTVNSYGKGKVFFNSSLEEVFEKIKLTPDIELTTDSNILFIHKKLEDGDIYFLTNQTDATVDFVSKFRVTNKRPELWNPINGYVRGLPEYDVDKNSTHVPLKLEAHESVFIVFREDLNVSNTFGSFKEINFPQPVKAIPITSPWVVKFNENSTDSIEVVFNHLSDWSTNENPLIKYYSGSASYSTTFNINNIAEGERVKLSLGSLSAIAKVTINDKYIGGVWTHPYSFDITDFFVSGENKIEVKVTNTWVNKLIGDMYLPEHERKTWTFVNPYDSESALHPSGLFGPVSIMVLPY